MQISQKEWKKQVRLSWFLKTSGTYIKDTKTKTKCRLFNFNIKSVLPYGSETEDNKDHHWQDLVFPKQVLTENCKQALTWKISETKTKQQSIVQ